MPVYIVESTLCNLYYWGLVAGMNSLQSLECQTYISRIKDRACQQELNRDRTCCHLKVNDCQHHSCKVAMTICQFPVSVQNKSCSINQDICQKWWSFLLSLLSWVICCADNCLSQLHPKAGQGTVPKSKPEEIQNQFAAGSNLHLANFSHIN